MSQTLKYFKTNLWHPAASYGMFLYVSALPGLSDHRHTLCMHHCGPKITKCVQTQCLELGRLTAEVRCIPNWIPWLRDEIKSWHTHTHWHSNYHKMQKNGVQDQFSVWVPAEMVSIMSLLRPKCSAGIRSAEEMHGILPGPQMHFVFLGSPLLMNAKATHDLSW